MRGFAYGLRRCAEIITENLPTEARRIITEKIHELKTEMSRCEDGYNFYLSQQITAMESVLATMYEMVKA